MIYIILTSSFIDLVFMYMDGLNIEHPLFQLIKREHEAIEANLKCLDRDLDLPQLNELINYLWNFAEQTHHYKEEVFLFSAVAKNPKITEGGPLCSLYFDFHMAENPIDMSKKITNREPTMEAHQTEFYKMSSPLRVPLDEHRSGKEIIKYMLDNKDKLDIQTIKKNLLQYRNIQTSHFKKEETCFLFMCSYLLTPKEADEILASWNRDSSHARFL